MSIMEIKGVRYSYDNKRNVLKGVSAEFKSFLTDRTLKSQVLRHIVKIM